MSTVANFDGVLTVPQQYGVSEFPTFVVELQGDSGDWGAVPDGEAAADGVVVEVDNGPGRDRVPSHASGWCWKYGQCWNVATSAFNISHAAR
ncbi:MAG: hypothetical protein ACRDQ5_22450 [Sciscionella sp.]